MARTTVYNKITSKEKLGQVNQNNIELAEDFLTYLLSIDRSEGTIRGYRNDLNIFWCWNLDFNKNKDFAKLTKREIARFQNYAINIWGWSPKRTRRVKSCLSSMSNYIQDILDEEEEFENFTPIIRKIENPANEAVRKKTVFSDNQVQMLMDELVKRQEYEKACSIAIAAYSGMRKSELLQMKTEFFSDEHLIFDGAMWETEEIRTKGKGKLGKRLNKYILVGAKPYIDLWLNERKKLNIDSEFLFVTKLKNENGDVIWKRRANLSQWTEEFTEIVGDNFYYHSLRHFTCSMLFRNNIPSDVIQDFFGWSSSEMLTIYNDNSAKDTFGKYFTKYGIAETKEGSLHTI